MHSRFCLFISFSLLLRLGTALVIGAQPDFFFFSRHRFVDVPLTFRNSFYLMTIYININIYIVSSLAHT